MKYLTFPKYLSIFICLLFFNNNMVNSSELIKVRSVYKNVTKIVSDLHGGWELTDKNSIPESCKAEELIDINCGCYLATSAYEVLSVAPFTYYQGSKDAAMEAKLNQTNEDQGYENYYRQIAWFYSSLRTASNSLIEVGYPKENVYIKVSELENEYVKKLSGIIWESKGVPPKYVNNHPNILHRGSIHLKSLEIWANEYRINNPTLHLPEIVSDEECGGVDYPIAQFIAKEISKFYLIPIGYYKICGVIENVNPDNIKSCEYWKPIIINEDIKYYLSGKYRYKALWNTGKVTNDIIDFDSMADIPEIINLQKIL